MKTEITALAKFKSKKQNLLHGKSSKGLRKREVEGKSVYRKLIADIHYCVQATLMPIAVTMLRPIFKTPSIADLQFVAVKKRTKTEKLSNPEAANFQNKNFKQIKCKRRIVDHFKGAPPPPLECGFR